MAFLRVRPIDPLNHAVPIVDEHGRPTPQFARQWILARTVNLTTDDVAVGLDVLRELIEAAEAALEVLQTGQAALEVGQSELETDLENLEQTAVPSSREVNTAAPLAGGGDLSANRTLSLQDSGVTAGTYGTATHVPRITVDAKGRITEVTEVEI